MSEENEQQDLSTLSRERLIEVVKRSRRTEESLRQRAQDAEAQRDELQRNVQAGQVDAWHDLAKKSDVLESALDDVDGRVKLSELLGEGGRLDPAKAQAALDGLKESHGYYFAQPPAVPGSSGSTVHTGGSDQSPTPTWSDFLAGA